IYASLFLRSHDDTADVHESLTNLESTIRSGSAQTGSTDRI
ncbi:MAG: hypothetical protein JWN99_3079, partial [Ilumatobacteraceae bacterium]|nr:hypothetical protein [Ilumatobacteraceae bacterium]